MRKKVTREYKTAMRNINENVDMDMCVRSISSIIYLPFSLCDYRLLDI